MYLVAGLGNPDLKYARNRHNAGFMVLDRWCEKQNVTALLDKFGGKFVKTSFNNRVLILFKPMTYMNRSGDAIQQAMQFYKIALDQVIVIHDELDLDFGVLRVKVDGGTAGHKGLKSIVQRCGGTNFTRLRVGIGRPRNQNVEHYVLSDFSQEESAELPNVIDNASRVLSHILERGAQDAMNQFHSTKQIGDTSS